MNDKIMYILIFGILGFAIVIAYITLNPTLSSSTSKGGGLININVSNENDNSSSGGSGIDPSMLAMFV